MEVSGKTLREAVFREKMRGYHPEDVDQFLEQVAAGIDVLHDKLRQAVERAQRAEAAAADAGGTDDTLRKTLVLAQRTADLAVQEAREQASRILASAEQQAQAVLSDAEERGKHTLEDAIAECRVELSRLESTRTQAQQEVDSLKRWLDEHKAHIQESLADAMAAVERAGVLWPVPASRPIDPSVASSVRSAPTPAARLEPQPAGSSGPETSVWAPSEERGTDVPNATTSGGQPEAAQGRPENPGQGSAIEANDQAMDDFFGSDDFEEDRRLGGRLRRRR